MRAVDVVAAPEGVRALLAATLIADDLEAARAAWPSLHGADDLASPAAGSADSGPEYPAPAATVAPASADSGPEYPAPAATVAPAGAAATTREVATPKGDRSTGLSSAQQARSTLAAGAAGAKPLTIITRDGDVLTEYVLRGGSGAKRSRLELVAERDSAAARLEVVTADIDRAKFALAEQRGILQNAKQQSITALAALREFDSRLAAQTERLSRLRAQVDASQGEYERLERSRGLAAETVAGAVSNAEKARAELETARARPRPILDVSSRDDLFAAVERGRESEIEARLQLETVRERVRAERARVSDLERQLEAERAAAEEAARRAVIRRRQVDAATSVVEALPAVLHSVDESVAEARLDLGKREAERAEQNAELTELRREESGLRERLQGITENVHSLELQIYEKKLHLSSVLERVGSELGLVEADLVAEYGPDQRIPLDASSRSARGDSRASTAPTVVATASGGVHGDATNDDASDTGANDDTDTVAFDRDEQKRRLVKAERMLAELGRVNPLALEEFDALEQRHKFLTEQLTDLTNTRKDLLTIIDEIDDKMKYIFESAFNDTREAFAQVFPILFPGGTGSISLTDPSDLLTTGVEVSVKPAGKKIERLSLLSGGERSLAAVALLIAIFKARPSPFYIMDEVEAALDDANLGRLLTIFQDLRETSQLIVITHQKRTMEIADALYGVSMRQDGVSAVIGQRVEVAS